MDADDDVEFPGLATAAKRLGLNAGDLAESLLARIDAGGGYWESLRAVVVEAVSRRGQYDGKVKAWIDSGDVFAAHTPMPTIETPVRMLEAVEDGRLDVFDVLAMAGALPGTDRQADEDFERRRAARLATVANDEQDIFRRDDHELHWI